MERAPSSPHCASGSPYAGMCDVVHLLNLSQGQVSAEGKYTTRSLTHLGTKWVMAVKGARVPRGLAPGWWVVRQHLPAQKPELKGTLPTELSHRPRSVAVKQP